MGEIREWWDDLFGDEKRLFMFAGVVVAGVAGCLIWVLWLTVGLWSVALIAGVVVGFRWLYRYIWGN